MKIYSDGKNRVLVGNFPARFELLQDGISVPFLRTSKSTVRITGSIPEGELDVKELAPLQRKKKEEQKNILDSMYLSIISEADFDRMEETQAEIQKVQDALSKQTEIVEKSTKEVLENEKQNAIDINQTNLNMAEMAKAFGKEIQADRDALVATSENIKQVLSETAEVLGAKLTAHEVAKNPHKITKATIGLDAVDNTSDLDKPVSKATQKALDEKADKESIVEILEKVESQNKKQDAFINNMNLYGGVGGSGGAVDSVNGKTGVIELTAEDVNALPTGSLDGYATEQYVDDNFQETLESGMNIKTINNESILGSGNIEINALQNTADGIYSLDILGNTRTNTGSVSIGYNSNIYGYNSVALGRDSVANILGVAIGYNAKTQNMYRQIAIGANSTSSALDAIQIGTGTNSKASSLCIGFNYTNYELLDGTTGKIPNGRLPIAESVSSGSTNAEVVGAKLFYDTCGDIESLINAL